MQRCIICAVKILAEAPKDRRADEFLEIIEALTKYRKDEEIEKTRKELETIPDEALDMHTYQGRRMGRRNLFWYEISSETKNKTPKYKTWHNWYKPLMIRLTKQKKKKE
ncbi:MAG: hypothetical protein ACFFCI_20315 [Promethearchaeota archaeon]